MKDEYENISNHFISLGLNKSCARVLTILAHMPALSLLEIGSETELSRPTTINAIHSLTTSGWIQREGNKSNRRYSLSMSIFAIINSIAIKKIDQHRDDMIKIQELTHAFE